MVRVVLFTLASVGTLLAVWQGVSPLKGSTNNMESRQQEVFDAFTQAVEAAEKATEQLQGVRSLVGMLEGLSTAVESLSWVDMVMIPANLPEEDREAFGEEWLTFTMAREQVGARLSKVAGLDREQGDKLARKMQSALEGEWLEDEEEEEAVRAMLTRWAATAPKVVKRGRPAGSGESATRTATLPFTVRVVLEANGATIHDNTDKNSARDAALKQYAKVKGERPKKGHPIWEGLNEALIAVIEKGSASAQGGGFIVSRAA